MSVCLFDCLSVCFRFLYGGQFVYIIRRIFLILYFCHHLTITIFCVVMHFRFLLQLLLLHLMLLIHLSQLFRLTLIHFHCCMLYML